MSPEIESAEDALKFRHWMHKDWWDEEPDRFRMEVNNAEGDPEKFLVVSGHATWLNIEKAREVRAYLDECIELMADG